MAVDPLVKKEAKHIADGGTPNVFYHPDHKANGHVEDNADGVAVFVPHGVPPGWRLDVAAWKDGGEKGAAPAVLSGPASPDTAHPQPTDALPPGATPGHAPRSG